MEMLNDMFSKSASRQSTARPRGTDGAKVIQVIETRALTGKGTRDDPCYISFQYWSLDGEFLAERQWARRAENERPTMNSQAFSEKYFCEKA